LTDAEGPYIVPVNFGYQDQSLYIHSAREGRKIEMLRRDNRVCFEITAEAELIRSDQACRWGTKYRSIVGFGQAFFLEGMAEKAKGLDILLRHYALSPGEFFHYEEADLAKVAVIQIKITAMTGKKSG
jgi:nitroimidazol reductase NimA-like FMN-containing flavoprotein (pyridoxamine 5'-phosphate oxidase superfamily)